MEKKKRQIRCNQGVEAGAEAEAEEQLVFCWNWSQIFVEARVEAGDTLFRIAPASDLL